ncbi:hypothetical protein [Zunongwangia profunda]|uniref:hypothetical protein n=1 Tax=Zunongwangia profunda TaxID=398743 RepID=UPI00248E357C|nr:hypothetical protein [Zunongwangia profunda]|tara:strand:- start:24316 stop:24741 length:426 start_codon:yes stop_codon:yes gene_type:complete
MDSKILQTESLVEREKSLKEVCVKAVEWTYPKNLSEDELSNLKDDLTKDSVDLAKLEEARKEFLTGHKAKVKPLKVNVATTLNKLRSRVEEVTEEVYMIDDQDDGMMGYYNSRGELVHQRRLNPEERQFSIVDRSKLNGTN